jgi:regulator of replication initiation timing
MTMKKIMIKILCGVITFAMAFSVVGCDKTDEMQSKLASLEVQIAEQTQEIKDLQAENEKLQAENEGVKVDLLEALKTNQSLSAEMENIEKNIYNTYFKDRSRYYDVTQEQGEIECSVYTEDEKDIVLVLFLKKVVTYPYPIYSKEDILRDFQIFSKDKIVGLDSGDLKTPVLPDDWTEEDYYSNIRQRIWLKLDSSCTKADAMVLANKIMMLDFIYVVYIEADSVAVDE